MAQTSTAHRRPADREHHHQARRLDAAAGAGGRRILDGGHRVPCAGECRRTDIKVIFVDEPDTMVNPMGIKGLGEIGIVGVAAAIANAVYHATGNRIRDLPIALAKLQRA